jgi:putative MATE family efflux protein
MRSEGATAKATKGLLLGIGLNVVLDPVFILALDWGVGGAAWATIMGMAASAVYYCLHFISCHSVLSIHPKDFKPTARMYAEILKIGIPTALANISMTISLVFRNRIASTYGDFVIAGSGINQRVGSISFMLIMALAMGYQPFAGFNYGAKDFGRLKAGFRITIIYSTLLSLFFTLVFGFGGRFIFTLFIRDTATVDAGVKLLRAMLWSLPFVGVQMTMMVTFQALGKAALATIVTMGRDFLFYLPLLFLFNRLWQFNGFMYSQPVADGLTTCIALLLSARLFKQLKQTGTGEINGRNP